VKKILILGAGVFGRRALCALKEQYDHITVVDRDKEALKSSTGTEVKVVREEAVLFLAGSDLREFDWIIPALPLHLAFSWLLCVLKNDRVPCRQVPVPPGLAVPNPYYRDGTLYTSLAEHICPPACPEPEGTCYLTGKEREAPLFEILRKMTLRDCWVEVVRSHQLAPGVGGIRPERLIALYHSARSVRGNILVATACACHGVLNMMGISSRQKGR
jgi:glycine/D-amino acid oxidase-like deaminating enzyme